MNSMLLILVVLVFVSKIFVGLGERYKIAGSLTELVFGLAFGLAARQLGFPVAEWTHGEVFHVFTDFGVLLLLFVIGLETDLVEMKKVGVESLLAAVYGVVTPFLLAFVFLPIFFPRPFEHDLFIAAALTATSIGITARVFKDLGILESLSGRVVLGAAVIDDVLGIVLLSVVTAYASNGLRSPSYVPMWLLKTAGFVGVLWFVSRHVIPKFLNWLRKFQTGGTLVGFLAGMLIITGWFAEFSGLSSVIGAFAIGVALDHYHFKGFYDYEKIGLEQILKPLTDFFVPMFFIGMGMQVDIRQIFHPEILTYAVALTLCAIVGKLVCGLALKKSSIKKGASRMLVGVGMLPRGEVGLIFAAMGKQLEIFNDQDFAAIIFMVIATTMLAPFLIQGLSSSSKRAKSTDE